MSWMSRRAIHRPALVVGVTVLYGALMSVSGVLDRVLLYPRTEPLRWQPQAQPIVVPFGESTLQLWKACSPGCARTATQAYVLELCGNATRAEDIVDDAAARWGELAVETWVLNYPGYGGSPGPSGVRSLASAALAAYDALAARAAGRPIVLAGNSIGTAPALYVAAQRAAAGVLLQNPPALRSLILRYYGWWNLWLLAAPIAYQVPSELDSVRHARGVKAPAVFIVSERDELVRPQNSALVVNAYAGPKRTIVLKGKGHNDVIETDTERAELRDALTWLLNEASR